MYVHTPQERLAFRLRGEKAARIAMTELLCIVSILRTAVTQLLPLAGNALWWVTLVALLPGLAVSLVAALVLHRTGTATLTEMARRLLGRTGVWVLCGLLTALLLLDAASSLTALVTLFTQGIGTRGTQLTLALLTCGALALCLHREGLPRGGYLLRWPLAAGVAVAAVTQLPAIRADHLFPLQGEGMSAVAAALRTGASLAWPLLLLLTLPRREGRPRLTSAGVVALGTVGPLLLMCLLHPQETLPAGLTLAGSLLLPARHASPAVQMLVYCLEMSGLFLAAGGAALLGAEQISAPLGRLPAFLPWIGLLLLTATQALDVQAFWQVLTGLSPWLLLPLAAVMALCLALTMKQGRRNRL